MYHSGRFNSFRSLLRCTLPFLLAAYACSFESPIRPSDESLNNGVFPGSDVIQVATPASGCSTGPSPAFAWQATGRQIVYAGVFAENIRVRDGKIVNSEANIWAWHTGLGSAREGNVHFEQGVNVRDGTLQLGAPPTPLPPGRSYVWAVWAWDESGTSVVQSSKEIFFSVETSGSAACS